MHRLVILASVVMMAASSMNCANSPERSSANILAPSALDAASILDASANQANGKPGGGGGTVTGGGSLTLRMVVDQNGDGLPNFRDTVTFTVQTTATAYPYVTLKCYKDGTLVSQESNAMFAGSLDENFQLGPTQLWTSGTASCTATLESWNSSKRSSVTVLASMPVTVNP